MGSWDEKEFLDAPDAPNSKTGSGKYLKHGDIPTDSVMILKYAERFQKDMTEELRAKIEKNGNKVGPAYWVYYFDDLTSGEKRPIEYTAFKKMTALTIAMKNANIEKEDVFTVARKGSGYDTRFEIVKLGTQHEVEQAQLKVAQKPKEVDVSTIRF